MCVTVYQAGLVSIRSFSAYGKEGLTYEHETIGNTDNSNPVGAGADPAEVADACHAAHDERVWVKSQGSWTVVCGFKRG